MAMKRCDNGHYYDDIKHTSCPTCGVADLDIQVTKKFTPQPSPVSPIDASDNEPVTIPANNPRPRPAPSDDVQTVAISSRKSGMDPVVGWLVCIEGKDKGRDYRLHSERNFVGRSNSMDVAIQGDETISRENHAIVTFNPKNKKFKLAPGDSRGLVYLNDDDVDMPMPLNAYDVIEIGETKLKFVPFCGDEHQWDS